MKNGFPIFLSAFVILGCSWLGFVLEPMLQLGNAKQTTVLNSPDIYPVQRIGEATLGLQVYRANGCAACHTTQVQQDGMTCEIELTGLGKNPAAVEKQISDHLSESAPIDGSHLPQTIASNINKFKADIIADAITAAGGKVEIRIIPTGVDIARGWGTRHSVAEDFLWDYPVQLGSLRAGPDLADVGTRLANAGWQLLHLYAPQSVVADSTMPSFRYLFEVRKIGDVPSPDALNLPKEFAPAAGYEVVPKPEAKQLAAYLLSLRADVPLYDAPFSQSQPSTNAPSAK